MEFSYSATLWPCVFKLEDDGNVGTLSLESDICNVCQSVPHGWLLTPRKQKFISMFPGVVYSKIVTCCDDCLLTLMPELEILPEVVNEPIFVGCGKIIFTTAKSNNVDNLINAIKGLSKTLKEGGDED